MKLQILFGSSLGLLTGLTAAVPNEPSEYDYVVVGSGPGGGSLAANLARSGKSVFLIEAGADHGDTLTQQVPFLNRRSAEDPTMSWQFFVNHYQDEVQARRDWKFTYKLYNGSFYHGLNPPKESEPLGIYYPRTGSVGGCASHDAMIWVLPPDNFWEQIADLTDDESWRAENMRRHFVALENATYLDPDNSSGHGFDGYISTNRHNVSFTRNQPGALEFLRQAYKLTEGIEVENDEHIIRLLERDINGAESDRYSGSSLRINPSRSDEMRRRSGPQNYINETLNAVNSDGSRKYPLTLSTNSLAIRVLVNSSSKKPRAYGVEYMQGESLYSADPRYRPGVLGIPKNVTATKEVIVAGGAFNTPQILLLSGIGPRDELREFGIPVVADSPAVGKYLQDNYEVGVSVEASVDYVNLFADCTLKVDPEDPCLQEWALYGTGPYGEAGGYGLTYQSSQSENGDADIFIFGAARALFNGFYPGYSKYTPPPSTFFLSVTSMQPHNHAGSVTLHSADPQDVPTINFNYFSDGRERDLQALSEGIAHGLRIFNATSPPWYPYTIKEPKQDVDIKQAILDAAYSHHASSSCRIGRDASDSCVDSRFRVHGVDGLRVVDASVFPRPPGGFPSPPVFVVGRKAWEVILEDERSAEGKA